MRNITAILKQILMPYLILFLLLWISFISKPLDANPDYILPYYFTQLTHLLIGGFLIIFCENSIKHYRIRAIRVVSVINLLILTGILVYPYLMKTTYIAAKDFLYTTMLLIGIHLYIMIKIIWSEESEEVTDKIMKSE